MTDTRKIINLNYDVLKLFSVPIHYLQIDNFKDRRDSLIKYAYDLKNLGGRGRNASNRGGWQSDPVETKDCNDILHELLFNVISNIPSFQKDVDIRSFSWININPPESLNVVHDHPNCDIAGVLWIKIPKNSGNFTFVSPYDFLSYVEMYSYKEEFKKELNYYHNYKFTPQEGSLLLFPSHLRHRVSPNKSNEDRISVSFNIKLLNVMFDKDPYD